MKALEKDRNRRYESASAFAADVQLYLADEAVAACPPSACYRLRKYARRNRRALVTAGVIVGALVAASVVGAWQAVVAREAQHQAEADRKQAEVDRDQAKNAESQAEAANRKAATDAATATAIADFLQQDLLRQVDMHSQRAHGFEPQRNLTVKEALDRAASRISQRFKDQPLIEASIRVTIGDTYHSIAEYQLAVPHLERAFALRKTHLGPDDAATIDAKVRLGNECMEVGRHADGINLHKQILENRAARPRQPRNTRAHAETRRRL
jgi:Tfp pilus assembly protein PilO